MISVSEDEAECFYPTPVSEDDTIEEIDRKAFQIVSPTFKSGNKWQLFDGHSTFYVAMADESFLDKIENGLGLVYKRRHFNLRNKNYSKFKR